MPLERSAGDANLPYIRPVSSIVALILGAAALIVAAIIQFSEGRAITTLPSPWVTVPIAAVAGIAVVVAYIRHERLRVWSLAGLGAAAVAVVLGYVVVMSLVAVAAIIVCVIALKFL